jgi:ribokinase
VLLQLEVPLPEVAALAARAQARGATVVLNAAPALPLPGALVANVDLLIVNESEAASYAVQWNLPGAPEAFVRAVRERFAVAAVVTLGAEGAVAEDDHGACVRRAPPPVAVVDATGAGDAFAGALAAALDRRLPMHAALGEALAAGAHACASPGAQQWPPQRPAH